jgi:hypothetical protein
MGNIFPAFLVALCAIDEGSVDIVRLQTLKINIDKSKTKIPDRVCRIQQSRLILCFREGRIDYFPKILPPIR